MRRLMVQIEVNGTSKYVRDITEKDSGKAYFTYADEYLSDSESRPISISLPLDESTDFGEEQGNLHLYSTFFMK